MEIGKLGNLRLSGAFRFERLTIWQKSIEFADAVYQSTSSFPAKEQYGLTSQLRRAAVSISANIAEGSSRASKKDFSRFVEIAFGSLCETVSLFRIAHMQGLITNDQYNGLYVSATELSKMLSAFRSSLGKWNPGVAESI